jgi:hypothetical protein
MSSSSAFDMNEASNLEATRVERVNLACVQCRTRHVKCDATQPTCNRCKRDGKECNYQKSRRGGLDKAALARRRLKLQQERARQDQGPVRQPDSRQDNQHPSSGVDDQLPVSVSNSSGSDAVYNTVPTSSMAFQINSNRLLELYYENFWPAYPIVLPLHFLYHRRQDLYHGMSELLLVLQYIGSIYAPWAISRPYYDAAFQALSSPYLTRTPFNVQALMLFAIATFYSGRRPEGQRMVDLAAAIALELGMYVTSMYELCVGQTLTW